ncbi:hypothetical protein [Zhihengliuella halotolerans]|nr:hypothetical protein [Zhihengliuella halotolerans]
MIGNRAGLSPANVPGWRWSIYDRTPAILDTLPWVYVETWDQTLGGGPFATEEEAQLAAAAAITAQEVNYDYFVTRTSDPLSRTVRDCRATFGTWSSYDSVASSAQTTIVPDGAGGFTYEVKLTASRDLTIYELGSSIASGGPTIAYSFGTSRRPVDTGLGTPKPIFTITPVTTSTPGPAGTISGDMYYGSATA